MSEKRGRSTALRNFTRNLNLLNDLFDEKAENVLVAPQFLLLLPVEVLTTETNHVPPDITMTHR